MKRTSPKNAGVKARPSPRCCFGATPLVGELPRSNGQTTAWPAAPSRVREAGVNGKRGARKSINLNLNPGGPSRSSSIAPAETINLNPGGPSRLRRARFSSAPTRQGIKRTSPKCRSESTPEPPDAVLARPLSWASYPGATGRPRPGQQRPRARGVADVKGKRGAPRCCFGATPLVGELPRSNGPRPGQQRPRARGVADVKGKRGDPDA